MAGSPKKRAKRESQSPPKSWAEDLAKQLMAPLAAQGEGGGLQEPALVPTPGKPTDRELLTQWWRDELASIEASLRERCDLLEQAGEHPNEIIGREVMAFGARGIPKDVAATLLWMSEADLQLHYGAEYAAGCAEVIARAAQNMMRIATSTNDRVAVKALTEFLNRRGGEEWRAPAQKIEVADNRPKGNLIDSSKLTFEERQALRAIIERAVGRRVEAEVTNAGLIAGRQDEEGESL